MLKHSVTLKRCQISRMMLKVSDITRPRSKPCLPTRSSRAGQAPNAKRAKWSKFSDFLERRLHQGEGSSPDTRSQFTVNRPGFESLYQRDEWSKEGWTWGEKGGSNQPKARVRNFFAWFPFISWSKHRTCWKVSQRCSPNLVGRSCRFSQQTVPQTACTARRQNLCHDDHHYQYHLHRHIECNSIPTCTWHKEEKTSQQNTESLYKCIKSE